MGSEMCIRDRLNDKLEALKFLSQHCGEGKEDDVGRLGMMAKDMSFADLVSIVQKMPQALAWVPHHVDMYATAFRLEFHERVILEARSCDKLFQEVLAVPAGPGKVLEAVRTKDPSNRSWLPFSLLPHPAALGEVRLRRDLRGWLLE